MGSHGGSPSLQITDAEMSIPGGQGADRPGECQNQHLKDGSHGGSPSYKRWPFQKRSRKKLAEFVDFFPDKLQIILLSIQYGVIVAYPVKHY